MGIGQSDIEREMSQLGVSRYRSKLSKARAKDIETATAVGRRLLAQYVDPFAEAIESWCVQARRQPGRRHRAVEYLELLPYRTVAALASRSILDGVASAKLFTRVAMSVASRLEDEVRFESVKSESPHLWRELYSRTKQYSGYSTKRRHIVTGMSRAGEGFSAWPQKDKLHVGVVLCDLFADLTGLVEVVTRTTIFGKTRTELRGTQDCHRMLLEAHDRDELLSPVYLPCVKAPRPWTAIDNGGFHTKDLHKRILVKTYDRQYLEDLKHADLRLVFKAVNGIQATPFRINDRVLAVFKHYWENSIEVAGLPSREDAEVPPKPEDIKENEESRKSWRRAAAAVHDRNAATRSERIMTSKILWLADKYKGRQIYFTSQLDFRGRQYPVALGLHPQGPSLCKGLLEFGRGKAITDEVAQAWLAVGIANSWGNDKLSMTERVAWTQDNQEMLFRIADDPYSNSEWQDADCPWTALAGAFEWTGYAESPDTFVSHMPVAQDATQSGLQILSLLTRNTPGAIATNCIDADSPQDLYGAVAQQVIRLLEEDGSELAQWWLNFGIDRSACKRQTMVSVYGGTAHSMFEYTRDWYEAKSAKTGVALPTRNTWQPCMFLSKKIREGMAALLSGPMEVMDWFQEVGKICAQHKVPVRWTSPLGMPIKQHYLKWRSASVKTRIGDKIRAQSLRYATDDVDVRKCVNSLTANFVHSLDAAAMGATVNTALDAGVIDFAMVHDSFATLASDSATLAGALRAAYAEIFSHDLLHEFVRDVESHLPEGVVLPPTVTYGGLDPSCVLTSTYFFN